jgi:chloramphenicol-sensitive protein RarD
MDRGILYGIAAFGTWGLFPIYWKALSAVPPAELLAHRIVWSLVFLGVLLARNSENSKVISILREPRNILSLAVSAFLIGTNWFTYIHAVNSGDVLATSLGYFITPLLNVLFGVIFLGEKLRRLQALSVGLAAAGVLFFTIEHGKPPTTSLILACSFGLYGLVRKVSAVESLMGLTIETGILAIPSLAYLSLLASTGDQHLSRISLGTDSLLILSGVITALPLLLFNMAAKLLPLSTVGIMQYLSPSIQFALAVFLFDEPFSRTHLFTFIAIWAALLVFTVDGVTQTVRNSHSPYSRIDPPEEGAT